jgi:predicted RNA binding protein YcfA (HicA-like mRNA interferase family)
VCIGVYDLSINNKKDMRMNSKEIIARLEKEGWYKVGGKGDHEKYKHPTKSGHVVVPHPRKDMPKGTLRNIYKQAGWEW